MGFAMESCFISAAPVKNQETSWIHIFMNGIFHIIYIYILLIVDHDCDSHWEWYSWLSSWFYHSWWTRKHPFWLLGFPLIPGWILGIDPSLSWLSCSNIMLSLRNIFWTNHDVSNIYMGVSINGDPQNGWFIRKIPFKWMIWGYPHLWKPPYQDS